MKILWLGCITLPRIAEQEGLPLNPRGGWLIQLSEHLPSEELELVYLFDAPRPMHGKTEFYTYYGLPCKNRLRGKARDIYMGHLADILQAEQPDVIHIWGTETAHTLAMVDVCSRLDLIPRVVISIQGLVSKCTLHYRAYLPSWLFHVYTPRDLYKGNLRFANRQLQASGMLEEEALRTVRHVIGRTEWDKACCWDINPRLQYHFNNEILREEFYTGQWQYDACQKHSIFLSQANYPIKGAHLALKALPKVLEHYPDAHLYLGGRDYLHYPKWKLNSYGWYLVRLIHHHHLEDHVTFTGVLPAQRMKEMYLKTNVFVSAASIENSPNSLGEAMLLGVPCIASHVGGVGSMLAHGKEGLLYPADEGYLLSYDICWMFSHETDAISMGQMAKKRAEQIYAPEENRISLLKIYCQIIRDASHESERT